MVIDGKHNGNAVITGGRAMAGRMSSKERETSPPKNADNLQRPITSTSTSTSTSASTSNDVETKEKLAIEERLAAKMFSYEIVCFLLIITFTALAALHSS